jgi:hypothetical protein
VNDVLPSGPEDAALPVSAAAVVTGVLVAYGAFALLISVVAAFANGAHSHQVLSAATWKQLGTGGGIVTGIVLFVAWGAGGLVAARSAGRDGLRHGVWVFIVGVVLMTVVGAAVTWLPDTTAILRNLRLLCVPLRRNEWRDFGTVAGVASILGMAAGSVTGGWWALRSVAPAPVVTTAPVPVGAPAERSAAPEPEKEEQVGEPAFVGPSLFEPAYEPEPAFEPEPMSRAAIEEQELPPPAPLFEPVAQDAPAWLQLVEERERAIRAERKEGDAVEGTSTPPEPAGWGQAEPAPTFIEEPEPQQLESAGSEPVGATSWWPDDAAPAPDEPRRVDDAWALPDDEEAPIEGVEDAAFPHPPPMPVAQPDVEDVDAFVTPPPGEHVGQLENAQWTLDDSAPYQAPPEPGDEHMLQDAPEAPLPEIDDEERDARRRQQEEAARAYEQLREDE